MLPKPWRSCVLVDEAPPRSEQGNLGAPVRRVLMPKTKNHVYWAIEGDEIVVISIWGARKRRGPKL